MGKYIVNLPIDRIINSSISDIVHDELTTHKNVHHSKPGTDKTLSSAQREFVELQQKLQSNLREEVRCNMAQYNKYNKRKYDEKRQPPTHYANGQQIYVDADPAVVGNKRKLAINRKKATIIDKISDNAYIVRYNNAPYVVEPVNVERMYTVQWIDAPVQIQPLIKLSNNTINTKAAKRNRRRSIQRARKRKRNIKFD